MRHLLNTGSRRLSLEISDEPGPDFLSTRGLQKGLIAFHERECLVQEGLGFGAPILGTGTKTYFSKNADLEVSDGDIIKTYTFDCAALIEMGARPLKNPALRLGFEALVGLYMRIEGLQPALLRLQQGMARTFNASCRFVDTEPVGTAKIRYRPSGEIIRISAEFETDLKGPQFIMVNEQGADFFDSACIDGRTLNDEGMTGWMSAKQATLCSSRAGLRFGVAGYGPARLFAGRERTPYLSWAGLDLHARERRLEYDLSIQDTGNTQTRPAGRTGPGVPSGG